MTPPTPVLKNVYTPAEFAAEVLNGTRGVQWVRKQCRLGHIRTVSRGERKIIPQSEALRFISPK